MDLNELRQAIDSVDEQMILLFERRMAASAKIALYKQEHNMPVLDAGRELEKLRRVSEAVSPELQEYAAELYSLLFKLSRRYQVKLLQRPSDRASGTEEKTE